MPFDSGELIKVQKELLIAREKSDALNETLKALTAAKDANAITALQPQIAAAALELKRLETAEEELIKAVPPPYAVAVKSKDIMQLVEAYHTTYKGKSPSYQDPMPNQARPDGSLLFVFENKEKATEFFKAQSEKGCSFLVKELKGDKPTGLMMFSCGQGMFFSGTKDEIERNMQEGAKDPAKAGALTRGLAQFKLLANPTDAFKQALPQPAAPGASNLPVAPPQQQI